MQKDKTEGLDDGDRTCPVKGCSTKHLNKRGQPVTTLALCNLFKGLSYKEKCEYIKLAKCCFSCTTAGHVSKSCKSKLTCQVKGKDGKVCNSKNHHTTLHKDAEAGGAKPTKNGKSDTHHTETATKPGAVVPPTSCHSTSSEPANAAPASAPQPETVGQDVTEVNSIRCFDATPTECYLADQLEGRDQHRLTNCGTVTVKGSPNQQVLSL